jgi:lipid-A-disaccharide synthase
MASAGVDLLARYDPLAVVGLWEVLPRLPRILRLLAQTRRWLREMRPDLLVLVDAPDFNFRLLGTARRLGIPVVYFVVPQFWAWRPGRAEVLARSVRRALTLFPFEARLLRERGLDAHFVGHPLAEELKPPASRPEARRRLGWDPARPLVALLPGSRVGEWRRHVPVLLGAADWVARRRPEVQWGLSVAPDPAAAGLPQRLSPGPVRPYEGQAWELLAAADAAVVASGTATLEAALLETPMVVGYRLSPLTYHFLRRRVAVAHVAMPNVLAGERVVPEFLQAAFAPERVGPELLRLLDPGEAAQRQRALFQKLRGELHHPGAYARAARLVAEVAGA